MKGFSRKTISHSWYNLPREVFHQLRDAEFTRKFCIPKLLRRKLTILLLWMTSFKNGSPPLMIILWLILCNFVMMTSISSSKTWLSSVWCYFSGIDKFLISWSKNLMLQWSVPAVPKEWLVHSHHVESFHTRSSRSLLHHSASFPTTKKTATSSTVPCIASTSATWLPSQAIHTVSLLSASCLKTYCRPTNQKCVITSTSWVLIHLRLLSHGSSMHLLDPWRLIR